MARVSLVLACLAGGLWDRGRASRPARRRLEAAGHRGRGRAGGRSPGSSGEPPLGLEEGVRWVGRAVPGPGGGGGPSLREVRGDVLLILDPEGGYIAEDLGRDDRAPRTGVEADLVVAARWEPSLGSGAESKESIGSGARP